MRSILRVRALGALFLVALVAALAPAGPAAAAEGQMTWAVHTSLVPTWFDPAESIQGTPFMVLSATHDALVKPMPGKAMARGDALLKSEEVQAAYLGGRA